MYMIDNIDITNFNYNGKYISELEMQVGGEQGFNNFSMTPQIEEQSETINGVDGIFTTSRRYSPRTFEIPLIIKNYNRIREISSFFSGNKSDKIFYWSGDKIYCRCIPDGATDLKVYYNQGGLGSVKFRCNDPFFYEINQTHYIITKGGSTLYDDNQLIDLVQNTPTEYDFSDNVISFTTSSLNSVNLYNDGSVDSKPLVILYGNGTLTFGLNGNVCTVSNISNSVTIDFKTFDVYQDANTDLYSNFSTNSGITIEDFDMIPEWNVISCNSNVTKIEIIPRSKWI